MNGMNTWMELMHEWNEWINEWMEWMNKWMNERMNEWPEKNVFTKKIIIITNYLWQPLITIEYTESVTLKCIFKNIASINICTSPRGRNESEMFWNDTELLTPRATSLINLWIFIKQQHLSTKINNFFFF